MSQNSIKISVRMSAEGEAITGSAWSALDLNPDFSLRISKDVNALSDVDQLITDGVLPFSVPFSTTNDAAFISFSSPVITDNFDTGIEARIVVGSYEMPFDRIWIRGKNDTTKEWDIEVRRSPNHWIELASEKKLCTVDCGQVTLSASEVADSWTAQAYVDLGLAHRWIPVDYGGWVDLSNPAQFTDPAVKRVWLEDLRPWISEPYLLKQAFCEIGWSLEGQALSSDWARCQFAYLLDREYYTRSRGGDYKLIGANFTTDFIPNPLVPSSIPYTTVEYDPGGNALPAGALYFGGITNNLPFRGRWKFCFIGTIENTGGAENTIGFSIIEFDPTSGFPSGQVLAEEPSVYVIPSGETRFANFCYEVELDPGQSAAVYIGASHAIVLQKGYRITIEPANKSLVRGDVVDLNTLIDCKYKLLDLFKAFVHKINGRVETDWLSRTVTIHPYRTTVVNGDTLPGFIRDGEDTIDISSRIICDSAQMSRIKATATRYTRLAWADSSDSYIDSLKLPEPAYSRKVLNSIELEDKVIDLKNPMFEPTLQGRTPALRLAKNIGDQKTKPMVYFPRLWDNTDGERSFALGARSLFFYGNVRQYDTESGLDCSFFFEGSAVQTFGYAAHTPILPFSAGYEPTIPGQLVYGVAESDMYVLFYLGFFQRQKRGTYIDALVYMSSAQYSEWDFRTPFFFRYNGRPVIALAESIRDFAPALESPTPIRFLVEPSDTQCCDLPCSCRFKECNYYQDFGQFITQETLDALNVSSFKVNGIEQLDAPVDFGILKVVEVSGKHFIANLVDTLNSIGVDYFTFTPSTKDYPDKPDARFFKIKYPSCWSFEIIISDTDSEVYRYRDFDMAQKWFSGTWDAMGYAANPVSEPQDCTITVEY